MDRAIIEALRKRGKGVADAYMEYVGNPARQLVGGGVRGYFGLDAPEYADAMGMDAYRNAAAFSNVPGVGAPAGAVKAMAAAPLIAKALRAAPREEALETARKNAVKMLGLPENNTAIDRAKALGFDVNRTSSRQQIKDAPMRDYFHGTGRDQSAFPEVSTGYNTSTFTNPTKVDRHATFVALEPDFANSFASQYGQGANVMPLYVRSGNALDLEAGITAEAAKSLGLPSSVKHINKNDVWQVFDDSTGAAVKKNMKSRGYDSAWLSEVNADSGDVTNSLAVIDPARIRSRFAAFDPARVNEADLLGRADPKLLAALAAGTTTAATVSALRNKRDEEKKKKRDEEASR
jgi:hypothetical protein